MTDSITPQAPQQLPPPIESTPGKRRRRRRWWFWALTGLVTLVVLWLFFIGSVELLHYTESSEFCSLCHVMKPEHTAYQQSPHERVECGTCHIGPGAMAAFQAKLANIRYLWVYPTNSYERPIPSPITSLRPVEVVCEQCHWPEKFTEDKLAVIPTYGMDEENSLTNTALLMKVGGGTEETGLGRGIHWHIANPVYYIATDDKRQDIPWVQAEYSGTVTEYLSTDSTLTPEDIANAEKRKMDCVDCHNRASHNFRRPSEALDQSLAAGRVASDLPAIKQKGVEVLEQQYATEEEAAAAIAAVTDFYKTTYPDVYASRQVDVEQAVAELQAIFDRTAFPFMNVDWQSHTNNIGHSNFPGCFRCHDGKHLSSDNEAIRLECNVCHSIPQVALPGQEMPAIHALPSTNEPETHHSTTWLAEHRYVFDETCADCHTVGDPGGTSNTSFCSNSACHGTEWKYAGLNAPAIRELVAPPREPGTGQPEPVPHPITADTNCLTCHGAEGVIPAPESHASFDITMCTQCHEATLLVEPAPVAAEAPPTIPHAVEGGEDCAMCHGEQGISPAPANHAAYTLDMCLMCHKIAPPTPEPQATPAPTGDAQPSATAEPAENGSAGAALAIPHDVAGREDCLACHATGRLAVPDDHEGRTNDMCLMCHTPAAGASEPAPMDGTPTTTQTVGSAVAVAIPHDVAGREDCLECHATGRLAVPDDHEGRSEDTCLMCHQPVGGAAAPAEGAGGEMPGIPHPIEGSQAQCRTCHATGSIVPFPENHQPFKNAECLDCHQPES